MVTADKILDYFALLKTRNILGPAYLFVGEEFSLVNDIIKLINCPQSGYYCGLCWDCKNIDTANHPDFFLVEPQGVSIKIEQIRQARKFLSLKSFRLKNKVILVKDAQNLGGEAASAFLKTLEEPAKNSFIAVCSFSLESLLPTIISRCRRIFLPQAEAGLDFSSTEQISDFLKGVNIKFKDRRAFSSFLWELAVFFRGRLLDAFGGGNKQLPKNRECEIISHDYSIEQIKRVLEVIFKVYSVYKSVNENLALNLIRDSILIS